jgi:hypothetical protein
MIAQGKELASNRQIFAPMIVIFNCRQMRCQQSCNSRSFWVLPMAKPNRLFDHFAKGQQP